MSEKPEPWTKANKPCRFCECETEHQYIPGRRAWHCLICGTAYREEQEPVKLTADDIWGG